VSFNGSANITVVAPATHAASSKTTPVDADELPLADSVATFTLAKVTWANIKATLKTYFDPIYAAIAGSASQVFSVAPGTAAANAARLDQISLLPTVISAAAPDIFAAAGATINYDNSTPATTTSFVACTAAQVGSTKKIITNASSTFTASANLVIDGRSSGNHIFSANAILQVTPISTTTFWLQTIADNGTITLTLSGTTANPTTPVTLAAPYSRLGRQVQVSFRFTNVNTTGATGNLQLTGLFLAGDSAVATAETIGFTTTTPVLNISAGSTSISVLEAATLNNIAMSAGTGKYLWGSIIFNV
jgi:hypothetical protein